MSVPACRYTPKKQNTFQMFVNAKLFLSALFEDSALIVASLAFCVGGCWERST